MPLKCILKVIKMLTFMFCMFYNDKNVKKIMFFSSMYQSHWQEAVSKSDIRKIWGNQSILSCQKVKKYLKRGEGGVRGGVRSERYRSQTENIPNNNIGLYPR